MTLLAVDGIHLNAEVAGSGEPLLLLHGFTGSAEGWHPQIAIFSARFRTIAVDVLGHGRSDSPVDPDRYRMAHCVTDLAAVLDQLGVQRANVLGYSMGGRVALHLAAAQPERVKALVLESASPGLAGSAERQARIAADEALALSLERDGLEAFVDRWERLPLFASQAGLPEPVRAGLRAQRLRNNPRGLANSLRGLGAGAQPSLWDRLAGLQTRTLLLAGALDPKFTEIAQGMAALLPAATLALVPEAGHAIHLEKPDDFARRVLEFLLAPEASNL